MELQSFYWDGGVAKLNLTPQDPGRRHLVVFYRNVSLKQNKRKYWNNYAELILV